MTPERWREVEALFDDTVDLPPAERDALLLARCADDPALRGEVEKMLADSASAEAMFEAPPLDVARALLTADDEADRDHVAPGQVIGAYRIVELLGRGGMGAVYLAERADGEFDKRVALKIVKRGMDTDEIIARFRRERQILARLEHPNIAGLYDGGVTPAGLPFFVMELAPGDPIDRWCDLRRASVDDRLRIFLTVCDAVQYAHRNLVVHRDLKPSNIIVCDGEPKLLDFGIAKVVAEEDDEGIQVTRLFPRRLTPEYAAPEQVTGAATTTATDVYSLGVILFELLTGRSPYGAAVGSYTGIEQALLKGEARPPSSIVARETDATPRAELERHAAARDTRPELLRSRLAGDLDAIVCKALQQEPERRYASADALADDIRRHLAGEPVVARPDTALYRWSKFVRRNRKTVALAGAAVAALVLGMVGTASQWWEATQARDAAGEAAERATAAKDMFVGVFANLNPDGLGGRTTFTRDELLGFGFAGLEELEGKPLLQAAVTNTLAQVAYSLGDLVRADSLFRRALDLLEDFPDDPERAIAHSGLGEVLRQRQHFEEAEAHLREALTIRIRIHPEGHPDRARARLALANLMYNIAKPATIAVADSLIVQVLASGSLAEELRGVAYEVRGDVLFGKKQWDQAAADYRQAIRAYANAYGETHGTVAVARLALAYALYGGGLYDEAETIGRQALTVLEQIYGRDHPRVSEAYYIVGQTLFDKGNPAAAVRFFETAATISAAVHHGGHPHTAQSWDYLGRSRFLTGDPAGAIEALERALVEYENVPGSGNALYEYVRYYLGCALISVGRWEEAVHNLRIAEAGWRDDPEAPRDELPRLKAALAQANAALGTKDSTIFIAR